jgi:hypothetical protein
LSSTRFSGVLRPAIVAGSLAGFVTALPLVGFLNCLCCAPIVACGALAAYLRSRECLRMGERFGSSDGTTAGLAAGLVYAVVNTAFSAFVFVVLGQVFTRLLENVLHETGTEWPRVLELLTSAPGFGLLVLIGEFGKNLVLGAIGGSLGGLLGGVIFQEPKSRAGFDPSPH